VLLVLAALLGAAAHAAAAGRARSAGP